MPDTSEDRPAVPDSVSGWSSIQHWFHEALEQPTESRDEFLNESLAQEPRILSEVRSLLDALEAGEERFAAPLIDLTAVGDTQLLPGVEVGMWTVLRKIGEGGMATVYEALHRDSEMPKRAALKTVRAISSIQIRARFARERRILATLEHPNIATLLDGGTLPDGRPWFAMEYVEGQRIDQWCTQRQLSVRARVRLLLQVCRAVDAAHRKHVVHRDIKPSNIFVTNDGVVKLLDFGIAKLAQDIERDETVTGAMMMTADYASPEQLRGDPISVRSDLYSLGVVAFELLSGVRPFAMRGQGLRDLIRLADTDAPRISQVVNELFARNAGLPDSDRLRSALRGDLELIVAKALAKDSSVRYDTAQSFANDLVAWLDDRPVSAHVPSYSYKVSRFFYRRRRMIIAASAVAATAIIAAAWISWQSEQTHIEAARAAARLEEVRTLVRTLVYDVNDRLAEMPGSMALRGTVVRTALQSLDRASSDVPNDPQLTRELAMAYQRAGDVLGNPTINSLGDTQGSLNAYRKALELTNELLRILPRDTDARWTHALTLEKLADVEAPMGSIDSAVVHQRSSLASFRDLAREDSINPLRLRAEGISALKLGDLLGHPAFANKGETDSAISAYMVGAERLEEAARHGDTSYFMRRHQAVVQERLGRLMQERQDYSQSQLWFERSLRLRLELVHGSPRSIQARRDVAIAYYLLCGLQLDRDDLDGAMTSCKQSYLIRLELLDEDPSNGILVRGMGIMHRKLADIHTAAHNPSAAFRELNEAAKYYGRFLSDRPGVIGDRRDYAFILLERANAAMIMKPALGAIARSDLEAAQVIIDSVASVVPLSRADSTFFKSVRSRVVD